MNCTIMDFYPGFLFRLIINPRYMYQLMPLLDMLYGTFYPQIGDQIRNTVIHHPKIHLQQQIDLRYQRPKPILLSKAKMI